MLLYLYGPDAYRRGRAVRESIVAPFKKKYPYGEVRVFDFSEQDALDELGRFSGGGLFAKAALALVTHPGDGGKQALGFLKSKKEDPLVTVVVIAEKKLNKDFAFLGAGLSFDELESPAFLAFLKAEAKHEQLAVSDTQIKTIGAMFAGDTWGAMTELRRVACGGVLAERAIPFDFVGSMSALTQASGETSRRLRALALLLENDDAMKTFHMAGGWARGRDKVVMADYDVLVKTGRLEAPEALTAYALGLHLPSA